MWIKDINSDESYIHVCDGKTEKDMAKKGIEIRKHDISTFTIVRDEKGVNIEHVKYCCYCGTDLEKE